MWLKEENNSSVSTSATTTASITSSLTDYAEIDLLKDFGCEVYSNKDDHSDSSSLQKILNDEKSVHIEEFAESLTSNSNEISRGPANK